jgi:hypothetical protein
MRILFESIIKFDKRIVILLTIMIASLFLFPIKSSSQTYQTPGYKKTIVFAPAEWHLGQGSIPCDTVSKRNDYDVERYKQGTNPELSPTITLLDYRSIMGAGDIGVFFISSHGTDEGDGIAVEYYDTTEAGRAARDSIYFYYIDTLGIPEEEIYTGRNPSGNSIGVTDSGIAQWHGSVDEAIVHAQGCHSAGLNDDWGALVAIGYDNTIPSNFGGGVLTFWKRMCGLLDRGEGNTSRSVGDAAEGIQGQYSGHTWHMVVTGEENVVMAPIIIDYQPEMNTLIGVNCQGYIEFDCGMNTNFPADEVITISEDEGALANVTWSNDHRIDFEIAEIESTGVIHLIVHQDKAVSAQNGAELDGNQYPANTSGVAPNRDNFVLRYLTPRLSFMDFENGVHNYPVYSRCNRPGVTFQPNWIFTHPGWSPLYDSLYYVEGFLGAWPGPGYNMGRIDFTGQTAQRIVVGYSAGREICLQARDIRQNLLAYNTGNINYGTGHLAWVEVEADSIAYCLISTQDTNYFVIDNLYVWDLYGMTGLMVPENYEILQDDMQTISQGQQHNYNIELPDVPHALNLLLNWGEGDNSGYTLRRTGRVGSGCRGG